MHYFLCTYIQKYSYFIKFKNFSSFASTIRPKQILESVAKQLNIDSPEKWYQVSPEDLKNIPHALELVNLHGDLYKTLSSVFKDATWIPWNFKHYNIPHGFWKDVSNQRKYLENLGKKLGYKHWSDWYNITAAEIAVNGGTGLLLRYNRSPSKLISNIFPEYPWQPFLFNVSPGYWSDLKNVKKAIEWLAGELKIIELDEWVFVSKEMLEKYGFRALVEKYGGLSSLLPKIYPEHNWNFEKNRENKTKIQQQLFKNLTELFPGKNIFMNYVM